MNGHLIALLSSSYYQCPPVHEVRPATIKPNTEVVEIITAGRVRFTLDGEEQIFSRGAFFWHCGLEHTVCKTFPDSPYRCFVLCFQVDDGERPGPRVSVWSDPNEAVAFARECHRAFHSSSTDRDVLAHYAYSTIHWKAFSNSASHPPQCPRILLDACNYMERSLKHDLSPELIAAKVNISRPYLFALFKKHFGKAPMHYLQELRISHAKALLTSSGNATIKDISNQCGFNELEVFYRQFNRQTGMTPAAYREKYASPLAHEQLSLP